MNNILIKSTNRIGITIGPGRMEPANSPVLRLMKVKRYGDEPQFRTSVPCSNLVEPEINLKVISDLF